MKYMTTFNLTFYLLLVTCSNSLNLHNQNIKLKKHNTNNPSSFLEISSSKNFGVLRLNHPKTSSFYSAEIGLGTPAQILPVIFDTGSSYTFIASNYCKDNNNCRNPLNHYNYTLSSTFKEIDRPIETTYGEGKITGIFNTDILIINDNIKLRTYIGEIIEAEDQSVFSNNIAGIIGLAGKSILNSTLFDSLVEGEKLTKNVISFYYGEEDGEIDFGFINPNKYKGELNHHKIINPGVWSLKLVSFNFEGGKNICQKYTNCEALIDTGTSGIAMSKAQYNRIKGQLSCEDSVNIKLLIDDKEYIITPDDYTFDNCEFHIFPIDVEDNVTILGEIFIKKYYTIFDKDDDEIQFGLLI
jgi:hypothetical protein